MDSTETPHIKVAFGKVDDLIYEFNQNLTSGGTFIPGNHQVVELQTFDVVLIHPTDKSELHLEAQVVMVSPAGIGVAFSNFNATIRAEINDFIKKGNTKKTVSVHERLRGLNAAQQMKFAREGGLDERVTLERMYSKGVWEPLLRNPRITVPEVARIARMGALPIPLLELISSNPTWLAGSPVRRALLSNPRLQGEMINKVLRLVPQNELKLITKQTAYSGKVREAARKLLKARA